MMLPAIRENSFLRNERLTESELLQENERLNAENQKLTDLANRYLQESQKLREENQKFREAFQLPEIQKLKDRSYKQGFLRGGLFAITVSVCVYLYHQIVPTMFHQEL